MAIQEGLIAGKIRQISLSGEGLPTNAKPGIPDEDPKRRDVPFVPDPRKLPVSPLRPGVPITTPTDPVPVKT